MTSSLHDLAIAFEQSLWKTKLSHRPESFWYPYRTLNHVEDLEKLASTAGLDLLELCRGPYGKVADIGSADGDVAFFLERQGLSVDVIDNEYTNFSHLEGLRVLKAGFKLLRRHPIDRLRFAILACWCKSTMPFFSWERFII